MSFAGRLRQAMEERSITQTELATRIGRGKSSVSQYLSGTNTPREDVQKRIAEALDCTVEWLNDDSSSDITRKMLNNVSIKEAATKLGKCEQFVRIALQRGIVPFGFAVKRKTRWSYHISPKKLAEYVGM